MNVFEKYIYNKTHYNKKWFYTFLAVILLWSIAEELNSFDSIFNLQVKTQLKKDLENALNQYGQDGKDGVTKAFDLLQEKVQYYCIIVYLSL